MTPELGSIAIKIYRGTAKENTVYYSTDRDEPASSFDELAVKNKNATETAGLATVPTPAVQARVRAFDYLDPPQGPPFMVFTFIYRSKAVLTAEGIIRGEHEYGLKRATHQRLVSLLYLQILSSRESSLLGVSNRLLRPPSLVR